MFSFTPASRSFMVSALVGLIASENSIASATNLRAHAPEQRKLGNFLCGAFSLFCDEVNQCPQVSPLGEEDFDLDAYIKHSWFIQRQQTTPYQSENQLYCTTATYSKSDNGFLEVDNYSNNDKVNGPVQISDDNGFFSNLCGKQVAGGELSVAPCIFRDVFDAVAGPYWVLDVAPDYSWAIVSGGQPDQPYPSPTDPDTTLCTTTEGSSFLDTNGSGLWLFTRARVANTETIELMERRLVEMGVFTGNLKDVTQKGCDYTGANLKEQDETPATP